MTEISLKLQKSTEYQIKKILLINNIFNVIIYEN